MRIAVISDLCLEPVSAGNTRRARNLVESLRETGAEVCFIGLGLGPTEQFRMLSLGLSACYFTRPPYGRVAQVRWSNIDKWVFRKFFLRGWVKPNVDLYYLRQWDRDLREIAAKESFDVVIVEYVFFSRALKHFPRAQLRVIDAHDIYTDRDKVLLARGITQTHRYLRLEQEIEGLSRGDAVLAIQPHDAEFFRRHLPARVEVVESGTVYSLRQRPDAQSIEPLTIVFVATDYLTNVDGLGWFCREILPLIKASVPNVRIIVYGSICRSIGETLPVECRGFIEDVATAYHKAVCAINPVLTGTGLKTKSIETLAHGLPLVSTSVGAAGMESARGHGLLIADEVGDFAAQIIRLLKDAAWHEQMSAAALDAAAKWNNQQLQGLHSLLRSVQQAVRV